MFAHNGPVRLYWRSDGAEGMPVLLLLNSIGTDMSLWDRVVPLLSPHFRLLRMDTRGHGASDVVEGDCSVEDLAEDAIAVLDAAGAPTAAICGLSLGGMVAMSLASRRPERVSALVLACTSAAMDRDAWNARVATVRAGGTAAIADLAMQRFFGERFITCHPDIVATVRGGLLGMSGEGYAVCAAAIRDMSLLADLADIAAPSLLIVGSKDVSTPFEGHGDRIATAIPGARVITLDTAHLSCLEDPTGFARAVITFLLGAAPLSEVEAAAEVLYERGLKIRRTVLGDDWVDRSLANRTPFNADFQAMITRIAWNEIWGRPGLDHRTRRLLVLAITVSLGRWEEFGLHVGSGLEQAGFSVEELKETLMMTAIYAGVPAANTAFAEAGAILARRDAKERT